MSWWNPRDWIAGSGEAVANGLLDGLSGFGKKLKDNPQILAVPAGAAVAAVAVGYAAKEYGSRVGRELILSEVL